jgi:ribosomal protein S18 acetylase RimI-like enzyme
MLRVAWQEMGLGDMTQPFTSGLPDPGAARKDLMTLAIHLRTALARDCADLAVISDMATRRLSSFIWGGAASTGQSDFEIGREAIRSNVAHFAHYRNWQVADCGGGVAGAINGYVIPDDLPDSSQVRAFLKPLAQLKAVARGTWYISALAVYPEYRGQGVAAALLAWAEAQARAAGCAEVTLMVGSFNAGARAAYRRFGFVEWQQRVFLPFEGSDPAGEWILMRKAVA